MEKNTRSNAPDPGQFLFKSALQIKRGVLFRYIFGCVGGFSTTYSAQVKQRLKSAGPVLMITQVILFVRNLAV